jgi:hypothetical protein
VVGDAGNATATPKIAHNYSQLTASKVFLLLQVQRVSQEGYQQDAGTEEYLRILLAVCLLLA